MIIFQQKKEFGQVCSLVFQRDSIAMRVCTNFRMIIMMIVTILMLYSSTALAYTDPLDTPASLQNSGIYSLLLDATYAGSRLIVVGERGLVLYSDDQGINWEQAQVPALAHLNAVSFPTVNHGWAVGDDSVVLRTEDGGKSWMRQYDERESDFPSPLLDVLFFDENEGFAIGAYGQFLKTIDGGKHWIDWREHLTNPDEWHLNAITVDAAGSLFIAGESGFVYRSLDHGNTWETLNVPHEGSFLGVVAAKEPGHIVVFGIGGFIFTTHDAGEHWTEITVDTESGLAGGALLNDGSVLIVGGDGIILKSDSLVNNFNEFRRKDRLPKNSAIELETSDYLIAGLGGILQLKANRIDWKTK